MGKITIEVDLKEYMDEQFGGMKEHLKTLNGKVAKNTNFRFYNMGFAGAISFVLIYFGTKIFGG